MKRIHPNRVLVLSCCLLVLARWSAAQVGLLTETNRGSTAAAPGSGGPARGPAPQPITIPAGTHVLMKLISPLHTTSSTPGSGVYLETVFPVVENDRVAIPEHTRVLGVMADERRPGRMKGRAQMRLRFTHLILPDDHELSIVGKLQSLPGSSRNRSVNREGTIEPVDQIDADVYTMAKATGAGVLGGALSHSGRAGLGYGALIGGGLGLAKVLFTRGDEISLPVGTKVEMVLQHSLIVQGYLSARADLGDTANARPSIAREQHAQQVPDHQLPDNMPCLRDGRTLQCVP
jgi:hypothetical protein